MSAMPSQFEFVTVNLGMHRLPGARSLRACCFRVTMEHFSGIA
jgi:hypothetical protein